MDTTKSDNGVIEEASKLIDELTPVRVSEMLQGRLTGYHCLMSSTEGTYVFIINLLDRELDVAARGDDQTIRTVVMASDIIVRKWHTAASEAIVVDLLDTGEDYELVIEYRRASPDTITGLKEILQSQLKSTSRV